MNWLAEDLRRRGIAVWNIDYRGVDRPGGGYPGTFQDVAAAADAFARGRSQRPPRPHPDVQEYEHEHDQRADRDERDDQRFH